MNQRPASRLAARTVTSGSTVTSRSTVRGFVLFLLLAGWLLPALAAAQEPRSFKANRIVLRVNDRIATLYDFERRLAQTQAAILQSSLSQDRQREELEEAPKSVMRALWDELLIMSRADQLGLSVSDLEIDETIQAQMEQFQLSTEDELRTALAREGLTLDSYRQSLRTNLLWRDVLGRELYPRIQVPEEQLRELYKERTDDFKVPEQRKVREIVVLETEASDEERLSLAKNLRSRWLAGDSPEQLVEDVGEEVARFIQLDWVGRGDLSDELDQVVWGLAAGDVTEPLTARGGLHLLQVEEIREESTRPYEEVRAQVLQEERGRRLSDEQEVYLKELEERAFFDADPPPELADFRTAAGRSLQDGGLQLVVTPRGVAGAVDENPEGSGSDEGRD